MNEFLDRNSVTIHYIIIYSKLMLNLYVCKRSHATRAKITEEQLVGLKKIDKSLSYLLCLKLTPGLKTSLVVMM